MKNLVALLISAAAIAQTPYSVSIEPSTVVNDIPANRGSAALWQSLKKLHTRASLIMITAHPDDEDGGMLAYESRGFGARVSLLTLNRGEGGANVVSSDYFDALGLVRTMELLQADRYYGVDQYWTRVIDYGFSKTKAESIGKWTHDRVLYDVVRVVRMVRPLVVTSVFVGGPSDGHGNHQTAGAMAVEVFNAAGDPSVFPDQIQAGLKPWNPLKSYARVPFSRRNTATPATNVEIPVGDYDPLLGMSYVQLSREGLGFQKSQNGGSSIPQAGKASSAYHRVASLVNAGEKENAFFDGIDTSLPGIAELAGVGNHEFLTTGLASINSAVENAISQFSAIAPEKTAPPLAFGLQKTIALINQVETSNLPPGAKFNIRHELQVKRVQFNSALIEALGLDFTATVAAQTEPSAIMRMFMGDPETFQSAIPGQSFNVKMHLANQTSTPVKIEKLQIEMSNSQAAWEIPVGRVENVLDIRQEVTIPKDAHFTRPYFSRPDIEQSYYNILEEESLNRPLSPYPLAAWANLSYQGVPIRIGQYVQSVKRVTGAGTVYEPLVIAPAISVSLAQQAGIVPLSSKSFVVNAVVRSNVKGEAKGDLKLELPQGWACEPAVVSYSLKSDGSEQSAAFQVTPASLDTQTYKITAVASYAGERFTEGYQVTGYAGLRPYFLYRPATYRLSGVDVKVAPDLKAGYIMGSGDEVPAAIEHLGVKVTFLSPADIAAGDLSKLDLIVLGVRTYAARDELRTYNNRLLEYVRNGGVMIVQYNTPEFDHNFGPYPYTMSSDPEEVTDEASKIQILDSGNPIFNWPNQITAKDFEGWVEERGSKWLKSWDPQYTALLETHDQDQLEQRGGLLYARYGKGIYVYNAYAFYRQLPEGVPGAYRIFANMLSLPRSPQR